MTGQSMVSHLSGQGEKRQIFSDHAASCKRPKMVSIKRNDSVEPNTFQHHIPTRANPSNISPQPAKQEQEGEGTEGFTFPDLPRTSSPELSSSSLLPCDTRFVRDGVGKFYLALKGSIDNVGEFEEDSRTRGSGEVDSESDDDETIKPGHVKKQNGGGTAKVSLKDGFPSRLLILACPFLKLDPINYSSCRRYEFRKTKEVKQHLRRRHMEEGYSCLRCHIPFKLEKDLMEHIKKDKACEAERRLPKSISEHQSVALQRYPRRGESQEQHWYKMWDIIFPGIPRPDSVHIKTDFEDTVQAFRRFWRAKGSDIISEFVQSDTHMDCLSCLQNRQILDRVMEASLDRFEREMSQSGTECSVTSKTTEQDASPSAVDGIITRPNPAESKGSSPSSPTAHNDIATFSPMSQHSTTFTSPIQHSATVTPITQYSAEFSPIIEHQGDMLTMSPQDQTISSGISDQCHIDEDSWASDASVLSDASLLSQYSTLDDIFTFDANTSWLDETPLDTHQFTLDVFGMGQGFNTDN